MTPTSTPVPPAPPPPSPSRPGRRGLVGRLLVAAVLLATVAGAAMLVVKADDPVERETAERFRVPALDVVPGTALPQARSLPSGSDVRLWAEKVGPATDIPVRTLIAYVNADLATRANNPGCNLTWATLAGIGRVESHHGHFRGTRVTDEGTLTKPIIGVPLNGSPGVQAIRDTDGGALDGDREWDRAVGAMQFLPTTWGKWAKRANGDGAPPDPQNVDDAALTAARYLCASGGDLATGEGWWKAVFTYNKSLQYGRDVYSGADAYARKVAELG
ncbi:lytic transglycosylase domain-containing protein [Actinokineospora alba]|uniref:lytic transglycosylase domain-containing protein n=1 Tax=Actinokineospora alba TaxID=504798 RepID=UPI001E383AC9|nr:murein transglycosylase [Actinokineospora alba]